MTTLQWAIIATIYSEPKYRFTGGERRAAERMYRKGWLIRTGGRTYTVSVKGRKVWDQDPMTIRLDKASTHLKRVLTRG